MKLLGCLAQSGVVLLDKEPCDLVLAEVAVAAGLGPARGGRDCGGSIGACELRTVVAVGRHGCGCGRRRYDGGGTSQLLRLTQVSIAGDARGRWRYAPSGKGVWRGEVRAPDEGESQGSCCLLLDVQQRAGGGGRGGSGNRREIRSRSHTRRQWRRGVENWEHGQRGLGACWRGIIRQSKQAREMKKYAIPIGDASRKGE